jgi:putative protease
MKISRSDINIMAPVGSYESLWAAIQGGADSIYFGVEKLNMRARSSVNFTLDDLAEIVRICKEHNTESYLTVNTVLFDEELNTMRAIVDRAKMEGVTAIIASDQSVINYAQSVGVEIHISTQLNVSNFDTLKFYAKYADVIVLARELNMYQVKQIYKQIVEQNICGPRGELVKIEMFCHGALCMATSGKCYLSLHEHNFSANRGSCLQTCRKAYLVTDKENGFQMEMDSEYIMSPKDLCTVGFLDIMLNAGVRVFKIEGRARPAEYVKKVCQCYNEAFNAIIEDKYDNELIDRLKNELLKVFNRGFWDGYYQGQRLGEWSAVYGSNATKRKTYLAKCTNYFVNLGVAEFLIESGEMKVGDEVLITGPTTGVVECAVKELRIDDGSVVNEVHKGQIFSILVPEKVRRNDRLYLWEEVTKKNAEYTLTTTLVLGRSFP